MRRLTLVLFTCLIAPFLFRPGIALAAANGCTGHGNYDVAVPGAPISAIPTPDEQTVFVALNSTNPTLRNGIAILTCTGGRYQVQGLVALESQPTIMALSHDGKTLVVPDDNFIAFVDAQKAQSGGADPITGYIEDIPDDDGGAIYAMLTPDDRYAFVAEEQSGKLTVIDLAGLGTKTFGHSAIVAEFLIGNAPVALVPSRDGKYVFATVQVALRRYNFDAVCTPEGAAQNAAKQSPGAIVTIDVARAKTDPDHAIVSYIPAGCHPVRAALTPDGKTLWVTARGSNAALAFDTRKLIAADPTAKVMETTVGQSPVPIIVTPDGRYVLVGNSNRFGQAAGNNQTVNVIDARTGKVVREITVGAFPRQFSRTTSGSAMFLCNYGSNTVTVIDPAAI